MKHKLNIQRFGGRGVSLIPSPSRRGGGGSITINVSPEYRPYVQFPELRDALGKKGKPINMSDAAELANPFYSDHEEPYAINCQRCVVAYELRRRGYDVIAQPNPNDKWATLKRKGENLYSLWRGAFRHAKTVNVKGNNVNDAIRNIETQMRKYGNGSRAVVEFLRSSGGGHVVNVENRNGRIVFIEAQAKANGTAKNSRIYTEDGIKYQMSNNPRHVALTRTDNLQVSYRASQFVDQKKHIRGGE